MTMTTTHLSKVLVAGLLFAAGGVHAAGPASVSEAPAAWYADQIATATNARGAADPVFPTAAYEHGPKGQVYAESARTRPSVAGTTVPFPASPNESGVVI
jgi:hypothetical protein